MLKMVAVRAVAERFVFGQAATAQRHYFSSAEVIVVAIFIDDFEVAFQFHGAV